MDEGKVDHSKNWLVGGLIILIGVLAIALLIAVFADAPQSPDGGGDNGNPTEPVDEELEAVLSFIDDVKPYLSSEGKMDIEMIEEYIVSDPSVLQKEFEEHPKEIQDAYYRVEKEYDEKIGSGEIENPDEVIEIGDEFTIQGTLELVNNDAPVGNVYKISDKETSAELYFVFPEATVTEIDKQEMIGKEVKLQIEITDVKDSEVSYLVLAGPELVE